MNKPAKKKREQRRKSVGSPNFALGLFAFTFIANFLICLSFCSFVSYDSTSMGSSVSFFIAWPPDALSCLHSTVFCFI